METRVKYGISIKSQRPLRLDSTTNHGISRAQEKHQKCKSGAQTQDGGNCSDMKEDSSQTCGITEFLTSGKQRMKNTKKLLPIREMVEETKNGKCNILIK
jgi:hypothetical protein